jgi:hypothetical protein
MKMTARCFEAEQHYCHSVMLELLLFEKLILAGMVMKYPPLDRFLPVPMSARSKAWVCGRSFAGIVGSNLTGGLDVCLLLVLCVAR